MNGDSYCLAEIFLSSTPAQYQTRKKEKWTCLSYLTSTSQPASYQPANTIESNRPAVPSLHIHYPLPEPQNIFIPQKRHG